MVLNWKLRSKIVTGRNCRTACKWWDGLVLIGGIDRWMCRV